MQTARFTCDRCNHSVDGCEQPDGWRIFRLQNVGYDLCDACAKAVANVLVGNETPALDRTRSVDDQLSFNNGLENHLRQMLFSSKTLNFVNPREYVLALSHPIVLGTPCFCMTGLSARPRSLFKGESLVMDVPAPGMFLVYSVMFANVSASLTHYPEDGYVYRKARRIHSPMIDTNTDVSLIVIYTGLVPANYIQGKSFVFTASFSGTAEFVGPGQTISD